MFGAARMCGAKSMDKEEFVKRNRMWDEFTLQSLRYVNLGWTWDRSEMHIRH